MLSLFGCFQIQKFEITLIVKDLRVKGKSNFTFRRTPMMKEVGMAIGRDDILMTRRFGNEQRQIMVRCMTKRPKVFSTSN